jgi:hypothetical protein
MSSNHRFSIGIDLGTTHCVLAATPFGEAQGSIPPEIMAIAQLVSPGQVETLSQLPSFIYQAHDSELADGETTLPWSDKPNVIAGVMARRLGSKTPMRLIASAKSWLCHGGVDRREAFLPIGSPDEVTKLSPLEASCVYLEHLKSAWDTQHPQSPLSEQDITLTVPASFDPAARELTAEAAKQIGLKHLTLLEEPQAALYSWLNTHHSSWRDELSVGDIVLVVDVGGGTTDLSLVAVTEQGGNLALNRVAVGDHILLGGDNMDLALAYRLSQKFKAAGQSLQPWQIQAMSHACRDAKETLLNDASLEAIPIVVPSRGSKLIGGTLQTELTQVELHQTLVDGFFPHVGIDEHPLQTTRSALTQMGLPYAQDAAISRHLAAFLCRQHDAAAELLNATHDTFIKPSAILFNGGVLKSELLATRLMSVINQWLEQAGSAPAKRLAGMDLDLAVAQGASYYGQVRQGQGVRIRGGLASSFYVGIESSMPAIPGIPPQIEALCVAPFGMEEGSPAQTVDRSFGLIVGQPVQFQFFGSTVRRDDAAGTLLDFWNEGELEELPPLQAQLPINDRTPGDIVPVRLGAQVTELGTLYLEAIPIDGSERWHVEFDVRA